MLALQVHHDWIRHADGWSLIRFGSDQYAKLVLPYHVVWPSGLRVRATPSKSGEPIGVLSRGTPIMPLEVQGDWVRHSLGWSMLSDAANTYMRHDSLFKHWVVVWPGGLRVRERASITGAPVGTLLPGTHLPEFAREGNWLLHSTGWSLVTDGMAQYMRPVVETPYSTAPAHAAPPVAATGAAIGVTDDAASDHVPMVVEITTRTPVAGATATAAAAPLTGAHAGTTEHYYYHSTLPSSTTLHARRANVEAAGAGASAGADGGSGGSSSSTLDGVMAMDMEECAVYVETMDDERKYDNEAGLVLNHPS